MPGERPRIALVIETSLAPGVGSARHRRYVRERGPWSIAHEPRALEQSVPKWLESWRGDGIIARVQDRASRGAIARMHVPRWTCSAWSKVYRFHSSHATIRQRPMRAEHLLDQGFRPFRLFGGLVKRGSGKRWRRFVGSVGRDGLRKKVDTNVQSTESFLRTRLPMLCYRTKEKGWIL